MKIINISFYMNNRDNTSLITASIVVPLAIVTGIVIGVIIYKSKSNMTLFDDMLVKRVYHV